MGYFRNPKSQKKISNNSIDGFLSDKNRSLDIRERFEQSYRPEPRKIDSSSRLDKISKAEEGFHPNNNQENTQILGSPQKYQPKEYFEDNVEPKTKRRKWLFRKGFGKRLFKGLAVAFIAMILGVSSIFAYGFIKTKGIFHGDGEGAAALQKNVDPTRLNGEGDGRINILLLGKGGEGHTAPDLTDTLLIASIDPIQNEAALLSIPRDLYVKDKSGAGTKINAIYANAKNTVLGSRKVTNELKESAEKAGLEAIENSIKEVTGIPIHYYVMIDFEAFRKAIDTVGGITIDVKEELSDRTMAWQNGGNPVLAKKGVQTFDGRRGLMYARSRYSTSDFDRNRRQREVIVALQKKVMSAGTYSNPFKILELINALGTHVRTDLNNLDEVKRLYEIGQGIPATSIISVGLTDPPNVLLKTGTAGSQSIVLPVAGMYQYDEIQAYVRNTIRDAFLKQEDAKVLILNGTKTSGLASTTSKELKSYGYNVIGTGDAATKGYTKTVLVDFSKGQKKYTKNYLEKRLKVTAVSDPPEAGLELKGADFVIILGTDETD